MIGRCLCGAVKFEADVRNRGLYQCHCSLCRRQSGTGSNVATIVPLASFRWISGSELVSSWVKDTGFRSDFCSRCGSPVPNPVGGADHVWVPAGLLEEPAELRVVAHLHVGSAATWDAPPPSGLVYAEGPTNEEFGAALRLGTPPKGKREAP